MTKLEMLKEITNNININNKDERLKEIAKKIKVKTLTDLYNFYLNNKQEYKAVWFMLSKY